MAKIDSRRPTVLPRDVLIRLDPRLVELYGQLPAALASRISFLVSAAQPQNVQPNRVLKFAYLYAKAEGESRGDPLAKEHTRRARLELAGQIHGVENSYQKDVEAKQTYRAGRRARQQIKASVEAIVERWRVLERVVHKHRSDLPVHAQSAFSDPILREVKKGLQEMGMACVLDEEDLTSENSRGLRHSEIAQAYIWWHLLMAPYRGKWDDMHRLALAWRMSTTMSVIQFRSSVCRLCKRTECTHRFEKTWESVLSAHSSS